VLPHQLREVGHIFICLLQEVGQALVLLLVDELAVALLIFCLQKWGMVLLYKTCTPAGAPHTCIKSPAEANQWPQAHS
jgi:hypothetical protein